MSRVILLLTLFIFYLALTRGAAFAFELASFPFTNFHFGEPEFQDSRGFMVPVKISTGGISINAIQVSVLYDPRQAEVEEILINASFCEKDLFLSKEIDNDRGEVFVACGLPSPGFNGGDGTGFGLVFKPRSGGDLNLSFGPESKMLANDGKGTEALSLKINSVLNLSSGKFESFAPKEITFRLASGGERSVF